MNLIPEAVSTASLYPFFVVPLHSNHILAHSFFSNYPILMMMCILCEIQWFFHLISLSLYLASFPFFFPQTYLDVLSNVNQFDLSNFPQRLLLRKHKLPNSCKGVDYFSFRSHFKVVQLLCDRKISRQRKQSRLEIHTRPSSTHQTVELDTPWLKKVAHLYSYKGTFYWPSCTPRGVSLLFKEGPLSKWHQGQSAFWSSVCLWHIEIIII